METRKLEVGYGAIAIAVACLLAYAISLRNGFAFDDVVLIPGDPRVRDGQLGALLMRPYWNDTALALYRPLTSLSYALDWFLSPDKAAWFHLTNTIWHVLASVFAFLLLTKYFDVRAALVAGLIFALHPVHVEAVANVVGRGELIAATFFLAACLIWQSNHTRKMRLILTALCYAIAMLSKESTVVLPAVLFIIDGTRKRNAGDYAVFFGIFVSFMLLRYSVVGGVAPSRLDPSIEVTTSYGQRFLTALQAWPVEAKLLLFPRTLLADYGPRTLMPITQFNSLAALGLTLIIATVVGGVVALLQRKYVWALALLWFPITILPVSNLIIPIGVLVAERTLYLPSLAICFAVAAVVSQAPKFASAQAPKLVVTVILLALAARTVTRVPVWKDTDTVMLALARDRPDSFRAQWHVARLARKRGNASKAIQDYDRALKLWPYREGLVQEAAAYGTEQGRKAWARDVAFYGTVRWPRNINFHRMVAGNAVDLGDTVTARRAVKQGLTVVPNDRILNDMWRAFGDNDENQ
ncbi:MAG TPA: glycosyltransferase family 39 protein [Longimicrobiales bacterium]|nr:glycosyltransferase family 39 protein [Longimicrobiales bacterium]